MSKKPLDILIQEHIVAKDVVKILQVLSQALEKKKSVSLLYLKKFIEAINSFLELHHKKEMEVFPYLVSEEAISRNELIDVLKEEHALGHEYLANIMNIVNHEKKDQAEKYELLPFHMQRYAELLKAHIEKEEHGFFPMMKAHLTSKQNQSLLQAFEAVEKSAPLRKQISFIMDSRRQYLRKK